jgi:membrane-associated phospholipid phosphatase
MFRVAPARLLIATAVGCLLLALPLHASDFDRTAFMAINDAAWRWGAPALFSGITILGHGLSAAMLLRAPNLLMAGLFATPVAMTLSWLPKGLIDSPRPAAVLDPASIHVVGLRLAGHNSFPSGHAITAFLVVGVLLAGERATRPRWPAALAIALVGIAVAASRIAVGAHWPSDALAGTGLGLLAGVAGAQISLRWRIASRPVVQALLALVVLVCAAILARIDVGYPLARPLQLVLAALGAAAAVIALWRTWATRAPSARIPE